MVTVSDAPLVCTGAQLALPDVSPVVEAAWIALIGVGVGIGGTVTVAAVGFRSTKDATAATNATSAQATKDSIAASTAATNATIRASAAATQATLDANAAALRTQFAEARASRLYDARAAVYVDLLAAITWRTARRQRMRGQIEPKYIAPRGFITPEEHEWTELDWVLQEARQLAFGSAESHSATQVCSAADIKATVAFEAWERERSEIHADAALAAMSAADKAEDELILLIRRELIGPDAGPLPEWVTPVLDGLGEE
jgi:hypothetical protein